MKNLMIIELILVFAISLLPVILMAVKRRKKQTEKFEEQLSQPEAERNRPRLTSAGECSVDLDLQKLDHFNRHLKRFEKNVSHSVIAVIIFMAVLMVSMVLGALSKNDMLFYVGVLIGMIAFFAYVLVSTIGFHVRLNRCSRQFWGSLAPEMLSRIFAKYGVQMTGDGKACAFSGSMHVKNEKYSVKVSFGAHREYHRPQGEKRSYYEVPQYLSMEIIPVNNPIRDMKITLSPNDHFSSAEKLVMLPLELIGKGIRTVQEAAGIEPNFQEAALDDPEFAKYFEASSSNPSEITSFLTPGQMQSILAIRRYMGRMKIRYTPEQIRVTFYDFEPAGYAGHNHTGLPLSFTAGHLTCLLRDMETLLQNLHGLWEELPIVP